MKDADKSGTTKHNTALHGGDTCFTMRLFSRGTSVLRTLAGRHLRRRKRSIHIYLPIVLTTLFG